jgi:ligand-binding sensor domain-containing protein
LLAVLVVVIGLAVRDNRSAALPRLATATPLAAASAAEAAAATDASTAAPAGAGTTIDAAIPTGAESAPTLGDTFRLPRGGFTLQAPTDYTLDIRGESALLRAEQGSATGMLLHLEGGPRGHFGAGPDEAPEAIFTHLADLYAAENGLAVGSADALPVGEFEGLSAALAGDATAGQFILVQPAPDQIFTLAASGPQDAWENQGAADVAGLIATLTFFAPEQPTLGMAAAASTAVATATLTPAPSDRLMVQPAATPVPTPAAATTGVSVPDAATPTAVAAPSAASPGATSSPGAQTPTVQIYSNGNFVNKVAVMRSTIWAATSGGVVAWNKSSGGYVKFTVADGLAANRTVAAAVCPLPGMGVLFAGEVGIQVFDTQNGRWRTLNSSNSAMRYDDVSTLWCDAERGRLVVGYTQHGLDIYEAESEGWRAVDEDAGLAISGVRDLAVARNLSSIWLATDEGLVAYAQDEATLYTTENSPLLDNRIETLAVDGSGAVWLATGNTLYRTDGEEWSAFNAEDAGQANFPTGRITGLDVGSDGAIWIGSDLAQICRFDPGIEGCVEFYSGEEGMATAPVTSLTVGPEGEVYYTTAGGGISAFDGTAWRELVVDGEIAPGNAIRDLSQDETGAIWIGALGGAARVSPDDEAGAQLFNTTNSPLPSADVRVVQPGSADGVWFGTEGVSFYDGAAWTSYTTADGLAGTPIQAMVADDQNRTWIGTPTGLSIWTGSVFFNLTTENGLPSNDISALLADGDVIWIGTRGGGLLRFQDNQLQVFNRSNIALPSDQVTALVQTADGVLWIGTDQGLARFVDNAVELVEPLAAMPITALAIGPDGEVWAVDGENSLYQSAGANWTPFTLTLAPGPQISTLLVDVRGDVWIGYAQGGLARYTP